MHYREARLTDIPELSRVRLAVRENVLRTPGLVPPADYLTQHGRGWLAEAADGTVAGFAIADLQGRSSWALFMHPDVERQGLGRRLHQLMLDWYFPDLRNRVAQHRAGRPSRGRLSPAGLARNGPHQQRRSAVWAVDGAVAAARSACLNRVRCNQRRDPRTRLAELL